MIYRRKIILLGENESCMDRSSGGGSCSNPCGQQCGGGEAAAANSAEMVYLGSNHEDGHLGIGNHAAEYQEDGEQEEVETNLSMLDINKANIEVTFIH